MSNEEEPLVVEHPLFIALSEEGLLEGMDYLRAEMQIVMRTAPDAQPLAVMQAVHNLRSLIIGGWLDAGVVSEGLAYAIEISGMTEDEVIEHRKQQEDGQ